MQANGSPLLFRTLDRTCIRVPRSYRNLTLPSTNCRKMGNVLFTAPKRQSSSPLTGNKLTNKVQTRPKSATRIRPYRHPPGKPHHYLPRGWSACRMGSLWLDWLGRAGRLSMAEAVPISRSGAKTRCFQCTSWQGSTVSAFGR